jgi:Flp pilus assembly protein TadB
MIFFAGLFFITLFLTIKNINSSTAPFYIFSSMTNLCAWLVLFASESVGRVLLYILLLFSVLLIYFIMKTKPYEKS